MSQAGFNPRLQEGGLKIADGKGQSKLSCVPV